MAARKKAPPKPKREKKDDRILLEFLAEMARSPGREAEILERRAKASPWRSSWPEMYARLPKFPDHLIFNSPNIQALASGCGLWHPDTQEVALASWSRAADLETSVGFELVEPGSRIYRGWSLLGRLAALRWALANPGVGDPLLVYLSSWLDLYWTSESLASVEFVDGTISLRCGARSQGAFNRLKSDYPLSIALGRHWKWRRKPHSLPDQAWRKDADVLGFEGYLREIEFSSASVRDAWQASEGGSRRLIVQSIVTAAPKWPTIAPTVYRRTSEGLAVWCERSDINGNTPGIAAMISRLSGMETAPRPSRAHKRQKKVPQEIRREGAVLHFRQSAPGEPQEFDLQLPGGELFYEVRHGVGGLEMAG